jgi:hypothetical protein
MNFHLNTVSKTLWDSLILLMNLEAFNDFRLVGGTSLSIQLGHRESVDIDLFTDAEYGSIDFEKIEKLLKATFLVVDSPFEGIVGMGKSYFIGHNEKDLVKLDLYYTDRFVFPVQVYKNIRYSCVKEIAAMKIEVVGNGGRMKDFWDLHELLETYTLSEMIGFYLKRYPYSYTKSDIALKFIDFSSADNDFLPICYRGKVWELIKLDFEGEIGNGKKNLGV